MTFRKHLQTPRVFKNILSSDDRTAFDLATNWTKEKLHRQEPEEKRAVDPDVIKYSSCFSLDMGDRKTFHIDHRWYEMECICHLAHMSLPQKMPDCSIRIPGLNGCYESPVVNTKFVMIYGGEYYLFYVRRDFGLEEGSPSPLIGSGHFKEMTPGDVKIVRIRNQHCLVKFTSLDPGWPQSECQPGEVIIRDNAPNLSPGLSFKGSYNGCLTTFKIIKVYPLPEPVVYDHPKLTTICASIDENEGDNVNLKDDDVFEIPGDRNRFCEIPELNSPLACRFRGEWRTFRVCRQLRYIVRGMLVSERGEPSVLFAGPSSPRVRPLNRFSSRLVSLKNVTRLADFFGHDNNETELRDVDAIHDIQLQTPSPVHSSCAEQDALIKDEGTIRQIPDLHQSDSTGASQFHETFPYSSPAFTGADADNTLRRNESFQQLGPPCHTSGSHSRLVASTDGLEPQSSRSRKSTTRSSSIRIAVVLPSSADSKNRVSTMCNDAMDLDMEVERMYNVLLGPLSVDI